jgi:predicted nucleic acid-binding protein
VPNSDRQKIVLDTYAWIEYFRGSEQGKIAKKFVEGNFELFTPSIVIAELSDKYRREKITQWEIRKKFIEFKTQILFLDGNIADKAGEMKQKLKETYRDAGLADAVVLAHSIDTNSKILTGDKHLRNLENSLDITKISGRSD